MIYNKRQKLEIETPAYFKWGGSFVYLLSDKAGLYIDADMKYGYENVTIGRFEKRAINRMIKIYFDDDYRNVISKLTKDEFNNGVHDIRMFIDALLDNTDIILGR